MSTLTLGQKGVAAAQSSDWDAALPALTRALEQSDPKPPLWLISRSRTLVAKGDFPAALADAELAYHVAADRSNRKLMMEAQYRRAVALYRMGRYADADCCCVWSMMVAEGKKMSEGEEQARRVDADGDYDVGMEEVKKMMEEKTKRDCADINADEGTMGKLMGAMSKGSAASAQSRPWMEALTFRSRCVAAMQKLEKGAPGRKVTAAKTPPRKAFAKVALQEQKQKDKSAPAAIGNKGLAATQKPKEVRVDEYQNDEKQTITIYVKGVDKTKFTTVWNSGSEVTMQPVPGMPDDVLTLKLAGDASASDSVIRVTPTKIELVIRKAVPGKWTKPSVTTSTTAPQETSTAPPSVSATSAPRAPTKKLADHPPSYPTSSRTGPKNWDAIKTDEDDGEGGAGPADADGWFKQLYAGATDEQKRAMMKSFTESNGTALSTDWNDVKSRTVETRPPEGVEARKWDEDNKAPGGSGSRD